MARLFFLLLFFISLTGTACSAPFRFIFPKSALGPENLAVIVNDDDPLSLQIADYYQKRRNIPQANMIHVRFTPGAPVMPLGEFTRIKAEVDSKTPKQVQAYALTWAAPYRVDCMSITSAFTFGFDKAYCSSRQCAPTKPSTYFDSPSTAPYTDLGIRPTMSLAGLNFRNVKALIDRGVEADGTHPAGTGYLVSTSDKQRNVRAAGYKRLVDMSADLVNLKLVRKDFISNRKDVLFYFTGLVSVPALDTLRFRPGAIADHLTSSGGQLTTSRQMSSLRWLEAGATGSYGSVVEPCNLPAKFPDPAVVIYWYLQGNSLIEAYWKSVRWPGEGIFIGEPLANPYGGYSVKVSDGEIVVRTQALPPGTYALLDANSVVGPYRAESGIVQVYLGMNELHFRYTGKPVYQLVRVR